MSEQTFQVGTTTAEPGTKVRDFLSVPGTSVQMPMTVVNGTSPGPRVLFTGGVHGGEYPPIDAAIRLARELDPTQLCGQVVIVHIVNPLAFQARQQYLVPQDGKNLNRQFPGNALGTYSERMAYTIMAEIVSKVDVWIDLHGGDIHEALVPFTIYSNSAEEDVVRRSRELAEVFGIEYVVASDSVKGGTYGASAAAGVPSILAEAGQLGQLDETNTQILLEGCRNVLRHLGALPKDPNPAAPIKLLQKFSWLRAEQTGCWYPSVKIGDIVEAEQLIGVIKDYFGDPLAEYRAPDPGPILFLVTSLAINEEDPLVGIGVE